MARLIAIGTLLLTLALVPLAFIARARTSKSKLPRLHGWRDMDAQEKFRAQQASKIFADGRAMRAPVPGTVARGELRLDAHFYEGVTGWEGKGEKKKPVWATDFPHASYKADGSPEPLNVDEAFIRRGQERYNIYCAVCHGYSGYGNGPVDRRIQAIVGAGKGDDIEWTAPANYHQDQIRGQDVGELFNTVSNGKNNMAGYRNQISPRDRWAIVAFIKALQRSQLPAGN